MANPRPALPAMAPIAVPPAAPIAAPLSVRCWVGVWPAQAETDIAIATERHWTMRFMTPALHTCNRAFGSAARCRRRTWIALRQIAEERVDRLVSGVLWVSASPLDEACDRFAA